MEQSPHVLVVDDEPELLHVLAAYLDRIGFRVTATSDVDVAAHVAHRDRVDVLLTDLCIGVDCGMTLIERMWALHPEIPVVLMSGTAHSLPTVPGMTFVAKPFGLIEIAGILRRTLRDGEELVGVR
jgi:two-component system OmpR family response regulator